jgi:hypothetical protein
MTQTTVSAKIGTPQRKMLTTIQEIGEYFQQQQRVICRFETDCPSEMLVIVRQKQRLIP